jgi:hypothetical protein
MIVNWTDGRVLARGALALLFALDLLGIDAGTSPALAQALGCKAGIDCCYIAASGHNPPRYSMAWDQTVGSGLTVLLSTGFVRHVYGPASGTACLTYWSTNIAPMQGYSPWRVGAASAMTDGTPTPVPGPQPVGPVAGGAEPPLPTPTPTPDKITSPQPVGPAPVALGPPPATGYWQLTGTQVMKRGHATEPGRTVTNELDIQEGAMSATFTDDAHQGEGPATWAGSATWTWNTPSGLARLIPGQKIEAQLAVTDRSVPEKKSGWRHGYTGVSCVIRLDNPALEPGASEDTAKDIVNLTVGEQKSETQKGSVAVPTGPMRWGEKMALAASCGSMGKFQRVYQWVPPGGSPVTQGGAQPTGGGAGTTTAQQQPNPGQPLGQQSSVPQPSPGPTTGTPVLPPWQEGQPPSPQTFGAANGSPGLPPVQDSPQPYPTDGTPQQPPGFSPDQGRQQPAPIQRVTKLFDNWNTAACALTGIAHFTLDAPTQITNVELWYNWQQGETTLPFEINIAGQSIARGQLTRGSCDPYQTAWCTATASLATMADAGSYSVHVARGRVCQNAGSRNNGFVRVRGMR